MPKPAKTKELCRPCYDDFYNHNKKEGCWSFDSATVCKKKFVHVDAMPPWRNKPEWTLSCQRRQRFVAVEPEVEC